MSVQKALLTAAVVLFLGAPGNAAAADVAAAPQYWSEAGPGPTIPQATYCPTCKSGLASFVSGLGTCKSCGAHSCHSCSKCGTPWIHSHTKGPYIVNLCPGACFGYFQTQWRKWD